jgi:hypothetical protein
VCDLCHFCEVRVCGLRCRSGSSLYIYRVYLLTYLLSSPTSATCLVLTTQDSVLRAGVHKYREILPRTSVLANANKPPPGTTTCAGRPSFARGGGSRRQLDLSAHTWRWARRGKKRREMPHVHQGSYGPPGADNMPRTAGAKRPTAAFARLRRERPQRRNRSARRCARRMRSSLNLSFAQPGASPAL